jgi:DNA repair exonuclease SbcCD ATPase subunit
MKLDQITDEVRLLGKHHIVTAEQLFSYKASVEEKIETLTADRTHLRKKIRTKIDDVELSKAKEEISSITEKLRTLRKEVRLCEGIAERSKVMEKNLEQIQTEEQTIQRKENRNYESRW